MKHGVLDARRLGCRVGGFGKGMESETRGA